MLNIFRAGNSHRALFVVERVTSLIFSLLSGVIVLRALGPSAFAVYGTTVGIGQIACTAARLSLDDYLSNSFARGLLNANRLNAIYWSRAVFGAAIAVGLWGSTALISGQGALTLLSVAAIAAVECLSLREMLLQAQSQYRILSGLGAARTLLGFSLRLGLFLSHNATVGAMLGVAIAELVFLRIASLRIPLRTPDSCESAPVRALTRSDWTHYFAVTGLSLAYSRLDFMIGTYTLPATSFGNYLAAQRFVEVYAFITTIVGALLAPQIATLTAQDAYAFAVRKSIQLGIVGLGLCVMNVALIRPLLPWLVGEKFLAIDQYFFVLAFGLIPLYFGLPLGRVVLAQGKPRVMMVGGAAAVVCSVALYSSLRPFLEGGLSLALSMVLGNSIGCAIVLLLVLRLKTSTPYHNEDRIE